MTGAVRSILMPVTDAGSLVLPALSVMVTGPAPRLLPSPVIGAVGGLGAGSMPESASSPTHVTVTSPLYQPAPFGSAGTPTRVGLGLVDVDRTVVGALRVAGDVDGVAVDGLTGAVVGQGGVAGAAGHAVDAGIRVGAGERHVDVGVVPAGGVRRRGSGRR